MKRLHRALRRLALRTVAVVMLALGLLAAGGAHASTVDISSVPLTNATASVVKPNLMFILDDSGSMDWDFMPDWVPGGFCRASGATTTSSGNWNRACCQNSVGSGPTQACYQTSTRRGHPPFMASAFNGVAYNPAVRYRPPANADGTSRISMTAANTFNWTSVPTDAYGVQSTTAYTATTISLLTQYPDLQWCTDGTFTNCLRNGNYVLPGTVGGLAYTTFNAAFATGSGQVAVGAPNAATTATRNFGPHYYRIVPGEWCTSDNLRDCASAPSVTHTVPAPLRWCNSDANARAATPTANSCQAVRTNVYTHARYPTKVMQPGTAAVPAQPARATFSVATGGTCNSTNRPEFSAVRVNSVNLIATATTADTTPTAAETAAQIVARINSGGSGYSATATGTSITITATVAAGAITHTVSFTRVASNSCNVTFSPATPAFGGFAAEVPAVAAGFPGSFERVDIVPSTTSYPKALARTDCAGATCTYDEEMTNFANWFAYYRTRMQTMKSGVSLAFAAVDDRFRVGYYTLNNAAGSDFRNLATFSGTDKEAWFTRMWAARPAGGTPLKTALSTVGRLYAGRLNGTSLRGSTVQDPMQYSCQKNFTLLSTDGYTNEAGNPKQIDGTTDVGNQDGTLPRPFRDGLNASNTLADAAAYYYQTDIRSPALNNCTSGSTGEDVCENNVPVSDTDTAPHQHMTTYTLGMGVSGFMQFRADYANPSVTTGDYHAVANGSTVNVAAGVCTWLTSGSCEWPIPVNGQQTSVDDLWHAAVNGRGRYISVSDPESLFAGVSGALAAIEREDGASAAATTSTPNVSAGDNFVFVSNYTSGEWSGELLGKRINLATGQLEDSAGDWSARERLEGAASRNIYMFSATATNRLTAFNWANLQAASLAAYFETTHIGTGPNSLSQFCTLGLNCLTAVGRAAAPGQPLVDFLRGDRSNEGTDLATSKPFRQRQFRLGDIVNSEAVYVRRPMLNYADTGYAAFKVAEDSRRPMVYVGANDGMLHAFDAETGDELWAYVPTMVIPRLYRLADKNYATRHQFYVDASPVAGDVKIGTEWRTILVGGLGAGGRGYYALDITDPANPRALWEFTNDNLGLSYGRAEIAKLANGTWVVILPSGYNNTAPGDGLGRLFILDAGTGTLLSSIAASDAVNPGPSSAGLAHIRAWVDEADVDNTVQRVYAGDNAGNVWRFEVNSSPAKAVRLAALKGSTSQAQPVTARPELGDVAGKAMVYVGTGRYLGTSDLIDDQPQSIYAIKDPLGTSGWGDPRASGSFVQQTLTAGTCPAGSTACTAGEPVRTSTSNGVNLATQGGWYVDLPVTRERSTNDPQLALGTLVVTTNVIESSTCTAGGYSFINFFDYRTGSAVVNAVGVVSTQLGNALATRPALISLPSGDIKSITRLSNATTSVDPVPVAVGSGATRRLSWRELATEQ
ncbi:MAG: pilus assembly protein [Betaproteobacteria bacterium]|nr:PilC/PilY family type IV pilus protein [Rubrivivax sp.]